MPRLEPREECQQVPREVGRVILLLLLSSCSSPGLCQAAGEEEEGEAPRHQEVVLEEQVPQVPRVILFILVLLSVEGELLLGHLSLVFLEQEESLDQMTAMRMVAMAEERGERREEYKIQEEEVMHKVSLHRVQTMSSCLPNKTTECASSEA